jgi:hypothetical protein
MVTKLGFLCLIQGCQMAYFQTKNPKFGKILEGLMYNGSCWYILWPFGHFYSHLVYFVDFIVIWFIFYRFGTHMYQEKSGNPDINKTKAQQGFVLSLCKGLCMCLGFRINVNKKCMPE